MYPCMYVGKYNLYNKLNMDYCVSLHTHTHAYTLGSCRKQCTYIVLRRSLCCSELTFSLPSYFPLVQTPPTQPVH